MKQQFARFVTWLNAFGDVERKVIGTLIATVLIGSAAYVSRLAYVFFVVSDSLAQTALYVEYGRRALPIEIVRPNTLWVLRLNPQLEREGLRPYTPRIERVQWPREPSADPEQAITVKVTNKAVAQTVEDIRLVYSASYTEMIPNTGVAVTTSEHIAHISVGLGEGEHFEFVIVNATPHLAAMRKPINADVLILGEKRRRAVEVLPKLSNLQGDELKREFPKYLLGDFLEPSMRRWEDVNYAPRPR